MTTLVEKDSPIPALLALAAAFALFVVCGLGLAYMGGVFTGKNAVAENDKRIAKQELLQSPASAVPSSPHP